MNDKYQRGFSMVEIVVVAITAGVLAAYAIPRMMGPGEFAVRTNADRFLAALQYAQTLAQRQGVATRVVIDTGTAPATISVQQTDGVLWNTVKLATENNSAGNYIVDIHPEVAIAPQAPCAATIVFGTNGIPSAVPVRCFYNINEDGVKRFSVTLEPSGYSHLGS